MEFYDIDVTECPFRVNQMLAFKDHLYSRKRLSFTICCAEAIIFCNFSKHQTSLDLGLSLYSLQMASNRSEWFEYNEVFSCAIASTYTCFSDWLAILQSQAYELHCRGIQISEFEVVEMPLRD